MYSKSLSATVAMCLSSIAAAFPVEQPTLRDAEDPPTLEVVQRIISTAERRFRNVQLTGSVRCQQRASGSAAWEYSGEGRVRGWFADRAGGKVRLVCEGVVLPWLEGDSPFIEEDYEVAYDGRIGTILYTRTGPRGATRRVKLGVITPGRPNSVGWGASITGWQMSTFGFGDDTGKRFSEFLGQAARLVRIESAPSYGDRVVRIQLARGQSDSAVVESWLVDLARGGAILSYEFTRGGEARTRFVVEELSESAGLYFPRRCKRWMQLAGGGEERYSFEIDSVVANQPVDQAQFMIRFPTGTFLEDQASSVSLHVGMTADQMVETIRTTGADLKASIDASEPVDKILLAEAAGDGGVSESWGWRNPLLGLLGVALLVLVGLRARRQVPRTATAALFCGFLALSGGEALAQRRSLGADELGSSRIHNCGLHSAAAVLEAFGRHWEPEDLARSLDCGEHWEVPTSLLSIQVLLESRGLTVQSFRSQTSRGVLQELGRGRVALIHCDGDSADDGHFLVLGGSRRDAVFRVDAGIKAGWVDVAKLLPELETRMTGYGLLVVDGVSTSGKEFTLAEESIHVDLGDISEVQGSVCADLVIRNPRPAPVEIHQTKASCSCFERAEFVQGGRALAAGQRDVLRLSFDKTKLALGDHTQKIMLAFRDPEMQTVRLEVRAVKRSIEARRRTGVMPKLIDLGVVRDRKILGQAHRVSLVLPAGVSVRTARSSSARVSLVLIGKSADRGSAYRRPSRTETYEARLDAGWVGEIDESLVFELTDHQLRSITVPIRGEVPANK